MISRRTAIAVIAGIVVLSFAVAVYFYPRMPEMMASHWNARGQVDGYIARLWGLLLMPGISTVLAGLLLLLPRVDPLRANVERFQTYYHLFVMAVLAFLLYLYLLTIVWNTGLRFNMMLALTPAFAGLFYVCGVLLEKAKRNWFIGIRTPWTLSSDRVWDRTHRLGGRLYKAAAVVSLLGMLARDSAIYFVVVPVIVVSVVAIVYSYTEYGRERRGR